MAVDSPVTSLDILPTIIDLLSSSSSLASSGNKIVSDLRDLYEGQSLLRPIQEKTKKGGLRWQFAVTNTGGSRLFVQASTLSWRLVVPLVTEVKWQFTDLANDPQEERPIRSMIFDDLLTRTNATYGSDAATWVIKAIEVSKWFVTDNKKRWRYTA